MATTKSATTDTLSDRGDTRFLKLIESPIVGILVHRLDKLLFANQAFAELLGYDDPQQVIALGTLDAWLAPGEKRRIREFTGACLGGESPPRHCELESVRMDGQRVWLEYRSVEIDWDGEPAILGAFNDVTARKLAESRLKDREAQIRAVMENVADAIVTIDKTGAIKSFNPPAERAFGYPADEVIGRNVAILMPEPDRGNHDRYIERYLRTGEGRIIGRGPRAIAGRRKDGSTFPLELAVSEMSIGGEPQFIGVLRDIAERKRTDQRLRQSQKMEALGTLAGGVAHDLANVLQIITGFVQLAQEQLAPESIASEYLSTTQKSIERARSLIRQILTFSGQWKTEREEVDLAAFVPEVMELLRATLPATIVIEQHFPRSALVVHADRTEIEQIVLNLCTNASQAMGTTGGQLTIALEETIAEHSLAVADGTIPAGRYVALSVADTGSGIDQAVRERMFEPFFSTHDAGGGGGLGLAVVHGIVQAHGGGIKVESRPGGGATLTVYLPAGQTGGVGQPDRRDGENYSGTERILFVDDEPSLLAMTERMLSAEGYDVVIAPSGTDALKIFSALPRAFDLVITDQTMPGMTGDSLARAVLDIRPDMPIILCTGYSEHIDETRAKALGIKAFLLKPILGKALLRAAREVLDAPRGDSGP